MAEDDRRLPTGPGAGGRRRSALPARLVERHDLSPTLARFRFELEADVPPFEPGQFVPMGLPLDTGRVLWRPYSIASPPGGGRSLELLIREVTSPPERTHLTAKLWDLAVGSPVLFKAPRGKFTIAEHHADGSRDDRRLLLFAGGTGLAPFVSCVLHRAARGDPRPIVLCHGARHVAELAYAERFRQLERASSPAGRARSYFRYVPTVSRPGEAQNAGWTGNVGRVETLVARPAEGGPSTLERALGEPLDPRASCAYVCGFDGTVAALRAALEPLGFRPRERPRPDGSFDLHWESYG